ncbi:hypothetical protein ACFL26_00760 [Patescibacteria group bacterium]
MRNLALLTVTVMLAGCGSQYSGYRFANALRGPEPVPQQPAPDRLTEQPERRPPVLQIRHREFGIEFTYPDTWDVLDADLGVVLGHVETVVRTDRGVRRTRQWEIAPLVLLVRDCDPSVAPEARTPADCASQIGIFRTNGRSPRVYLHDRWSRPSRDPNMHTGNISEPDSAPDAAAFLFSAPTYRGHVIGLLADYEDRDSGIVLQGAWPHEANTLRTMDLTAIATSVETYDE